jgi:hypothetical protein
MFCSTVSRLCCNSFIMGAETVLLHQTVRNHIWEDNNLRGLHHKHAEIPSLSSYLAGFSGEEFPLYILVLSGRQWPLWQAVSEGHVSCRRYCVCRRFFSYSLYCTYVTRYWLVISPQLQSNHVRTVFVSAVGCNNVLQCLYLSSKWCLYRKDS